MAQKQTKPEDFFPLGEAELKELKKHSTERSFAKGAPLWQAGDNPESVWMVVEGRVNMNIESAEGASSLVHFCTKAQTFCPAAAISGRAYPCTAIAATPVKAISIPRSSFLNLFNKLPKFAKTLLAQMAPQVCESHCQQALSSAPVKSRLATTLSQLNTRFSGGSLPFTRQELANMSGTTVETTIRTLSEWEKEGVIESQRGSIQIRELETLEEACA